jgi:hypothetical protein
LKDLGFTVTLWTHPFVNHDCEDTMTFGEENGILFYCSVYFHQLKLLQVILSNQKMEVTKRVGGMAIQHITSTLLMKKLRNGTPIGSNYYKNSMVLMLLNLMQEKVIILPQIQYLMGT